MLLKGVVALAVAVAVDLAFAVAATNTFQIFDVYIYIYRYVYIFTYVYIYIFIDTCYFVSCLSVIQQMPHTSYAKLCISQQLVPNGQPVLFKHWS